MRLFNFYMRQLYKVKSLVLVQYIYLWYGTVLVTAGPTARSAAELDPSLMGSSGMNSMSTIFVSGLGSRVMARVKGKGKG